VRYLKGAGIAWGIIYLAVGAIGSFTLNGIDFLSSITILVLTFLLPLPIAIVAYWLPKLAGVSLILSMAICVTTLICLDGVKDTVTASPGIRFYIPHLIFAVAYIVAGLTAKNSGVGGDGSLVGPA